jgi:murein DD-endopeptidase MepM/ murein hydrolase activator NlpD
MPIYRVIPLILLSFCQRTGSTFLKGVWFIIAGVLLLGHTSVLAEPYLRVCKHGVVYYYFSSREPPQSRQGGRKTSALRDVSNLLTRPTLQEGEALIPEPSQHHNLPPASVKALSRTADLPVVNPFDFKNYIWAGSRDLIRLLTKFGYPAPLALPANNAGPPRVERHQDVPFIQASGLGQMNQGSDCFKELNQPLYSFPVSFPFSFRDTWGDYREGGRLHRAVDIFAPEGARVYAITAGVIVTLSTWKEAGITLLMRGYDGRGYGYMHLQGYAEGIVEGKTVRAGELIGYVGRTGLWQSAAHLHFQVYADHRLCKAELLNPYYLLVRLCHGIGVTDLYHHKIARLEDPEIRANRIQVYRRPGLATLRGHGNQLNVQDSSVWVIRNF